MTFIDDLDKQVTKVIQNRIYGVKMRCGKNSPKTSSMESKPEVVQYRYVLDLEGQGHILLTDLVYIGQRSRSYCY